MRQPGDTLFNQPIHIDGGGIERWKDPAYRQVYRHIFEGHWKDYDPFEADYRAEATMSEAGTTNGCSFFRAFQGWLSMSHSGPGKGTLRVLPLLKEPTAFWMLRPFASDVPEGAFPGCYPSKTFHVTQRWHKLLADHLVSLPEIGPGDTVWWHPDIVHTVENHHEGDEPNAVFYTGFGPDCRINRNYLRHMRHSFLLGTSPPDFPEKNNFEVDYKDRAAFDDLSDLGLKMAGFPQPNILTPDSFQHHLGTSDKGHSFQCKWP